MPRGPTARGSALLVTLVFVALFASMALAIAAAANVNLVVARNRLESHQATAFAETGILLLMKHLGGLEVPATDNANDIHQAFADHLAVAMDGSSMVNANAIDWDEDGAHVPEVTLARMDGFTGSVQMNVIRAESGAVNHPPILLECVGRYRDATQTIRYYPRVMGGQYQLPPYGIASKSAIRMTGNASVEGANNPDEGSILSATWSENPAIQLTGNVDIAGDVSVCNPDAEVAKMGNISIGGEERRGAGEPLWPEVDASAFEAYATNIQASGAAGNQTLTNIRIPAGTNPTFAGNTTVLGVVYVESPNTVHFSGNCSVTGVIVCEEPDVPNLSANKVQFTGNLSTSGVENLPEGAEFDGLREMTGSFLLAPGYSTKFTGNFHTVNGCMIADQFQFTGNAGGRVKGGVICLSDSDFEMTGNANLTIDRETADPTPAGVGGPYRIVCVRGAFEE
jgi:hypothetical protein